jgi:hypothetical protein
MIISDGKCDSRREEKIDLSSISEVLGQLLGNKLDGLLSGKMGILLEEIKKNRNHNIRSDGGEIAIDDEESLKHIAKIMASKSEVYKTNITELGNKQELKDDGEKNRTIDLLNNLPD